MRKCPGPAGLLLIAGLLFLLSGGSFGQAAAQSPGLTVTIGRPAEGETFYSGPSSLQYNISINGWAFSEAYQSTELEIRLDILQGDSLLSSQVTRPGPDGSFLFNALLNPQNSAQIFPAEHAGCADTCHFPVELALPAGATVLRVTATDPAGRQASTERRITVDRSTIGEVPVQLVLDGEASYALQGVQVTASTRLYLWRSRNTLAAADEQGLAVVPVEVLSEAPTTYTFRVEPHLLDGVLFSGTAPVTLTLLPGVLQASRVTLHIRAQTGRIEGRLAAPQAALAAPLPVLAFHLPEGECHKVQATSRGEFTFESLPIGRYLVTLEEQLAELGYTAQETLVDLTEDPEALLKLAFSPQEGRAIAGSVSQEDGSPLPFAWVEPTRAGRAAAVQPDDGRFHLAGLDPDAVSLIASAPGYYSYASVVPSDLARSPDLALSLVRRPEMRSSPWGDGEILIPPESGVTRAGDTLDLEHGWLWGSGGSVPAVLRAAGVTIRVAGGRFALENIPGKPAWFYLFEGQAELQPGGSAAPVSMQPGQMVLLEAGAELKPVEYRPELIAGLALQGAAPNIEHTWQPSLQAVLRDQLARLGIGTAQALTLITYMLVLVALIAGPLLVLAQFIKRRRSL
jgi:hypothetical protein